MGHLHRPQGPASISDLNLMTDEANLFDLTEAFVNHRFLQVKVQVATPMALSRGIREIPFLYTA